MQSCWRLLQESRTPRDINPHVGPTRLPAVTLEDAERVMQDGSGAPLSAASRPLPSNTDIAAKHANIRPRESQPEDEARGRNTNQRGR